MELKRTISASFLLLALISPAKSQKDPDQVQPAHKKSRESLELFESNDILNITVRFDLSTFLKKNLKGKFIDGTLAIYTGKNDSIVRDIWVTTRGIFRLQYCGFPPMEIVFKKPFYGNHYSTTIHKIKLATRCQVSGLFEEYLMKEYLAYRMYNAITDSSFRVRLVRASYIDNRRYRKPDIQYGFFIEPQNLMASRLNSSVLKNIDITQRNISPPVMNRVAVFNYMIGNYDWAVPNQHNISILSSKDSTINQLPIAVPHDFDWTGLVNPMYAIPEESAGVKSVKERLYLGMCQKKEVFRYELRKFIPYKQKFYSIINEFPYLSRKAKDDMINYLDEFYQQVEDPRRIDFLIDNIISTCKYI
ncbi:MAG TPA: hypothetical protein VMT63_12025 [Bacteroidales bacterium]|nr:hypothetical protein [Bacteroidales bacterium]